MHWIVILGFLCCILQVMALTAYSSEGANTIAQEVQRRLALEEKANRLIGEQSPYLLQHCFNPVDWYSWAKEAFAMAVAEDKTANKEDV